MKRKALIFGGIFGLIAPLVGIFMGLQISLIIGNILAFPFIIISYVTGTPFGYWSASLMVLGFTLSVLFWGLVFGGLSRFFAKG